MNLKLKKKKKFNKFKVSYMEPKTKNNYKLNHKRKYKPDDIRKKIKARFHKSIKNIINENLKRSIPMNNIYCHVMIIVLKKKD